MEIIDPILAGWPQFWGFILSVAISYATRPDPPRGPRDAAPASLEEFQMPSAEDGATVPVLFGRRHTRSPHVAWYGDLRTEPIRERTGG